jgi:hypothetical protein
MLHSQISVERGEGGRGEGDIRHILIHFRVHPTGHENINNLLHNCTMPAWMH